MKELIKKHIKETTEGYLDEYGKGLVVLSTKLNKTYTNSNCILDFEVITLYDKDKKASWIVAFYKDGSHAVFFNGSKFI